MVTFHVRQRRSKVGFLLRQCGLDDALRAPAEMLAHHRYIQRNLRQAGTKAVLNAVNPVGVMGKGIALDYRGGQRREQYQGN